MLVATHAVTRLRAGGRLSATITTYTSVTISLCLLFGSAPSALEQLYHAPIFVLPRSHLISCRFVPLEFTGRLAPMSHNCVCKLMHEHYLTMLTISRNKEIPLLSMLLSPGRQRRSKLAQSDAWGISDIALLAGTCRSLNENTLLLWTRIQWSSRGSCIVHVVPRL